MKISPSTRVLTRFTAVCGLIATSLAAAQSATTPPPPRLWYIQPATVWNQALPVGNGHLGAMVFGGANTQPNNGDQQDVAKNADIADGSHTRPQDEHLQLNETTVWQGSRADLLNPRAHEGFLKARELLLASHGTDAKLIAEAEALLQQTMISVPRGMPGYSTLGDLYLRTTGDEPVTHYRRELELTHGLLRITYTVDGIQFTREIFASAPDDVIVIHLTASKPGAISFTASMDRPADFTTTVLDDHNLALKPGPKHTDQIRFYGQLRVLNNGGKVSTGDTGLIVNAADDVTLLITAATDFKGGNFDGSAPDLKCHQRLDAIAPRSYTQLRDAATADVARYMQRTSLRLGPGDPALEALPTDERLRRVSSGADDLGLQALYFQFARYLLVESSRPGGMPANLQGLWAGGISNPWGSKYTININTEMNYWMAEAANLGEMHLPVVDLLESVKDPRSGHGEEVAQKYYGAHGFVIHHNTDIWGDAHSIDGLSSGIWPMGGAWLTLDAWDHFAFTNDKVFLHERAWPLLHDASLFFLDYLTDDGSGHLVTGPSLSPENRYKLADGSAHSITMAPTMDIEIVHELFLRTLQAGAILHSDAAFLARIHSAQAKLPPFRIGHAGNLQEWQQDYADSAPGHRHISHLWALFPGSQIDPLHTPELAKAAQTTLETRLNNGGGQTGWSRAWVVNYWDRLHNGERAYESLQVLFKQSTFPNMMDTHPPGVFQIDGNLGAANGMIEALVQSRWYPDHTEVDLMPALPKEWSEGELHGIRIRGGGELNLQWSQGKLREATWHCDNSGAVDLRLQAGQTLHALRSNGKPAPLPASTNGATHLALQKGVTYQLTF